MSYFRIRGGTSLHGNIAVYGSKNAALPLLAASLLTKETIRYSNIPEILDVEHLLEILEGLGVKVDRQGTSVTVTAQTVDPTRLAADKVGLLRGSILLMGALLGRFRQVQIPLPGGDLIGARPLDAHLDAFRQLGARIDVADRDITIDGQELHTGRVVLPEFSVTATENALLAAATLPGKTTIHLAATEPHVVALCNLLETMGASVQGKGTHTLVIEGAPLLGGGVCENIPDMLEAGAFVLMAAATQSSLTIQNAPLDAMISFLKKLEEIGVAVTVDPVRHTITVEPAQLNGFKLQTLPHPGIATDLQSPFSVIATQAKGTSLIHDPMYESRFRHIPELVKMGARVTVCDPHRVIIQGPTPLHGRTIPSLDIRSGITLVMAGLVASGETVIEQAEIIDRGYASLNSRLAAVGADITRA